MVFSGVGVALTTLFDDRLQVDVEATTAHAVRLEELGCQAIVVAGTTGEAAALDRSERAMLTASVKGAVSVPVVVGTGAPTPYQAVKFTQDAVEAGADAILALSPPGSNDLRAYYTVLSHVAGDTPLLAYHFPKASSPGFGIGILPELPVVGFKDSSGDAGRLLEALNEYEGQTYVGAPSLLSMAGPMGAAGAILAVANVEPERCIAAWSGDVEAQKALHEAIVGCKFPLENGLKYLMSERFGTATTSRIR
jgi:4-hydroxy-tetrahydrodipicolinate synthase